MKGIYRFYQEGVLVAESQNILTTAGKRAILRYLAGRGSEIGASIALGTGIEPATVEDHRLTFEAERVTIDVISINYNDSFIIFKGTIPQESVYHIHEVGIYNKPTSTLSVDSSRTLATFENEIDQWVNGTFVNSNSRIGEQSLKLDPAASGTVETSLAVVTDLSNFTPDDNFLLAFTKNSSNASSLILKFKDVEDNSYTLSKSISGLANGYHVLEYRLGDFVVSGPMSWANVSTIAIATSATAGGGSEIFLDGLRIEDDDSVDPDFALVSRSVLVTPKQKTVAAAMDVEYTLELNFA